jgi:hypothetical protein
VQYDIVSDLYGNKSNGFSFYEFVFSKLPSPFNRETEIRRVSESEWNNIVRSTFQNRFSVCLVIGNILPTYRNEKKKY